MTTDSDDNVVALSSIHGMIHANASSYVLHTHGGTITRARLQLISPTMGGRLDAPYLWETNALPWRITSMNGADTMTFTQTSDGIPHSVVYASACTATKWYDLNTHACYTGTLADLPHH